MSNWWVYQWDSCLSVLKLTVQSISSVQLLSRAWLFVTPWTVAHWLPCPSPISGAYSNSCPLRQWCHPTISSSVVPFSSYLQSFPTSGSFQMSQFFASGGQSIGVSASASVVPMNNQDSFPLGWTGWISLLSKGLFFFFFLSLVVFVIHWHESAIDLHIFPVLIPAPTSLSTRSVWVFPVHQSEHLSHASSLGWWSVSP